MPNKVITLNEFWSVGGLEQKFPTEVLAKQYAADHGGEVVRHGAQKDFVLGDERYSAYIGGIGSGKTFAGIVRGLQFAQQQKPKGVRSGPRGLIAAINYPVLDQVVIPEFMEVMEDSGLWRNGGPENSYLKSQKRALLVNDAEVLFRSLDRPNWMRGLQLSWFFIDEGRHVTKSAWDILVGRLRQPGFDHGGWVCSTPNGYDWMYELFHEESEARHPNSVWYNASTYDNQVHLPDSYIKDLEISFEDKFFEQEVLGRFIGLMGGGVFPHWNANDYAVELAYDPELPLYTFWDFGVADLGVCLFAQIEYREKQLKTQGVEWVPYLRVLDEIAESNLSVDDWAKRWHAWLRKNIAKGMLPTASYGDPAGRARNQVTGTSVLDEFTARGVPIFPAPKRPEDYSVVILDNMMAGGRVLVDAKHCPRLNKALATYHYPTDDVGNRTSDKPVHDWTSNFCAALRYGAASLFSHTRNRTGKPDKEPPGPGTIGHILEQINAPKEEWLGGPRHTPIEWQPGIYGPPA